jgi:cytoplasmic iron level regulating protein YaaA (DUF328/UPF0246 family)
MPRINEHAFELVNEKYILNWYDNKPRLTKNGVEQKILPILREYIRIKNLPIQLVNSKGNAEVPYTLARNILKHFSNNKKTLTDPIKLDTKPTLINSNNNSNPSIIKDNNLTLNKDKIYLIPCSSSKISKKELENKKFKFENLEFNNELGEFRKELIDKLKISEFNNTHKREKNEKKNKIIINIKNEFNFDKTAQAHKIYSEGKLYYKSSSDSINWTQKEKEKIYIVSALFGIIRADNYIPLYDLAMTDQIDGNKNYAQGFWKGKLDRIIEKLNNNGYIIYNILSGPYNFCIINQHLTVIPNINWNDKWGQHKGEWLKEKL